jgi:transposase
METSHVCVVDADGRKIGAQCVDSTPEAIAAALHHHGPIERAVIETGRMTPSIALGLRELGVAIVCIDARQAHQSLKAMKANKPIRTTQPAWRNWRARASTRRCTSNRRRRMASVQ